MAGSLEGIQVNISFIAQGFFAESTVPTAYSAITVGSGVELTAPISSRILSDTDGDGDIEPVQGENGLLKGTLTVDISGNQVYARFFGTAQPAQFQIKIENIAPAGVAPGTIVDQGAMNGVNSISTPTYNPKTKALTFNWNFFGFQPGTVVDQKVFYDNALNDPPVAVDDIFTYTPGISFSGKNVLNNDTDLDNAEGRITNVDLLQISKVGTSGAINTWVTMSNGGQASINANGLFQFNPNNSFKDLNVGQQRNTSIDYTVTDSTGLSDVGSVTVTVIGVNDAPTDIQLINAISISENTTARTKIADLSVIDPDVSGNANVLSVVNDTRFEITGNALYLKAGQAIDYEAGATIPLTLRATDGALTFDKAITVAVTNVNEAPNRTGIMEELVNGVEDTAYIVTSAQLLAGFTDAEGSLLSVTNLTADHGSVTVNGDQSFTIAPNTAYAGALTLNYIISDGQLTTPAQQSFTLKEADAGAPSLLWHNNTTGALVEWRRKDNGFVFEINKNAVGKEWEIIANGNFNGDAKSDILWMNKTTGLVSQWNGTDGGYAPNSYVDNVSLDWKVGSTGDFNGDGKADILWVDKKTGGVIEWQGADNGFIKITKSDFGELDWIIERTGDFNGDSKLDVLWRNQTTGTITEWQGTGQGLSANTYIKDIDTSWEVGAIGDFNGDGKSDIIWRNQGTGELTEWQGSDTGFLENTYTNTVQSDWLIAGIGDFNGDKKSDILWRNRIEYGLSEWQGSDSGFSVNIYVSNVDKDWIVAGIDDFNRDGKSDILWKNENTGFVTEWQGNNSGITENTYVGNVDNDWSLNVRSSIT